MSEAPRRSKTREAPELPSGYRQSRRGSGAAKATRKAERRHRVMLSVDRFFRGARNVLYVLVQAVLSLLAVVVALLLVATVINSVARWNAARVADRDGSFAARAEKARENLLVIGVEGDRAVGFLALRIDAKGEQVFGIAIPDGAFVDVPGRGFERIGESFAQGPELSLSTVSNFLTVPFENHLIVPAAVYKDALTTMSVSGLPEAAQSSSLSAGELAALSRQLASIPSEKVAIVPMPVKPIKLGDQTYFEPQRDEIADLLESWWGVDPEAGEQVTRVIVYNGAGMPGVAGEAAQQLIRAGFRVVDTKNADSFDYKTTRISVRRGGAERGDEVRSALGVGEVVVETSTADVADVIIVIGKDYRPPTAEKGAP